MLTTKCQMPFPSDATRPHKLDVFVFSLKHLSVVSVFAEYCSLPYYVIVATISYVMENKNARISNN